jgi:aryl-alcohol dehydrogenase-like predicted oxidoreductase
MRLLMGDDVSSVRAGALRYVLDNENVASAIIGPRSSMQVDQLLRDGSSGPPYLSEERKSRLEERLTELKVGDRA